MPFVQVCPSCGEEIAFDPPIRRVLRCPHCIALLDGGPFPARPLPPLDDIRAALSDRAIKRLRQLPYLDEESIRATVKTLGQEDFEWLDAHGVIDLEYGLTGIGWRLCRDL